MMFPSHLSVTDLGVFALAMVFGLMVVLLFTFDFVSIPCFHWPCVGAVAKGFLFIIVVQLI